MTPLHDKALFGKRSVKGIVIGKKHLHHRFGSSRDMGRTAMIAAKEPEGKAIIPLISKQHQLCHEIYFYRKSKHRLFGKRDVMHVSCSKHQGKRHSFCVSSAGELYPSLAV